MVKNSINQYPTNKEERTLQKNTLFFCFFASVKQKTMKYLFLSLAIVLEVIGSSFMKASDGFSKLLPTAITVVAYIACFFFLSQALKSIPLGIAYAIWGGLGIVLTAIISVIVFKQSLDIPAIIGIILIVAGVVVMNFFSKSAAH